MQFTTIPSWSFIVVVSLLISVTSAKDVCYTRGDTEYYCDSPYTCCYANTKCCYGSSSFGSSSSSSSYTNSASALPIAAIVGIVIGSIIFVSVFVTIMICKCVKQSGRSGRVIKPSGQTITQAYPQPAIHTTLTSGQYQPNLAGQNGHNGNTTAYYQPYGQILPPNPPNFSENANQNSEDQVAVAIPKVPE